VKNYLIFELIEQLNIIIINGKEKDTTKDSNHKNQNNEIKSV
jgi:hypothetical protein